MGPTGRLHGRRIIVTGAGRGLGFAYAQRLAAEGADVVIAEIDAALGQEAEGTLRAKGYAVRFIQTDISSEASVAAMAAEVGPGGIYGLVANAAWANNVGGKAYDEIDSKVWDRMMEINVKGTWLTVKAIAPTMLEGGSIVTISSGAVFTGTARLLHYVTSKSAIVGMSRSLARELAGRMIRVNCVCPGLTLVEATKDLPQERWQEYAERKLFKRDQVPDDLSGVIAFLMSDDSRYITAQTLAVDGGMVLF